MKNTQAILAAVGSGVGLVSATWASPKRAATLLTAATTTC
jgi:hypothetical protein